MNFKHIKIKCFYNKKIKYFYIDFYSLIKSVGISTSGHSGVN